MSREKAGIRAVKIVSLHTRDPRKVHFCLMFLFRVFNITQYIRFGVIIVVSHHASSLTLIIQRSSVKCAEQGLVF